MSDLNTNQIADVIRLTELTPNAERGVAVCSRVVIDASNNIIIDGQLLAAGDATHVAAIKALLNTGRSVVKTASSTLTAADTGKTLFLNSATEFDTVLPVPALDFRLTVIVKAAPSGASYTLSTNASANIIKGSIVTSATGAADTETSGGDTVNFVDGAAVAGDKVEIYCDGTNYFAYGQCVVAGGITITTAS